MNDRLQTTANATLPAKQRALPDSLVAKIFSKFEARYGSLFLDRWRGCDMENVVATWAEELAGFSDRPDAIGYALRVMANSKFPPTLPEFIEACRRAPEKEVPALPYHPTAEDIERSRGMARSLGEAVGKGKIRDGIDEHWATHPRSEAQLRAIFAAAERDQRFRRCIAQMVEDGIYTAEGVMLRAYRDNQFVSVD